MMDKINRVGGSLKIIIVEFSLKKSHSITQPICRIYPKLTAVFGSIRGLADPDPFLEPRHQFLLID
jgi:hypothetical protein